MIATNGLTIKQNESFHEISRWRTFSPKLSMAAKAWTEIDDAGENERKRERKLSWFTGY